MNEQETVNVDIKSYLTVANLFTLLNLVIGFSAVVLLFRPYPDKYLYAAILVLASAACDFLDGVVARKRNESTEFGKHLDSVVDMASFGIVPAVIFISRHIDENLFLLLLCGAFYISAGASRLARFNVIDTADGTIKGLPITVAAVVLALKGLVDQLSSRDATLVEEGILIFVLGLLMLGNFTLNKFGYRKGEVS